jgi:hypothetical protein
MPRRLAPTRTRRRRAELRDGHPPRRRDYTYPRWRNQYGGLKADDAKGRSGQVRPLGTGHAGANGQTNAPQAGLRAGAYVASKGCGPAHRRLNALLSAGSLSASVKTAQTASRSSSLRTFPEPGLPSTTAPLIDTAMLAKPFCLSLRASSSTCSGVRRTKERSRHRTVNKLSAPAFIRVLSVTAGGLATVSGASLHAGDAASEVTPRL